MTQSRVPQTQENATGYGTPSVLSPCSNTQAEEY